MNKIVKLLSLCITLYSLTMNAQSNIDLPDFGLSLTIPAGWTGQQQDGYLLLGHTSIPGLMILFENPTQDVLELQRLAMEGIADEGIELVPKSNFQVVNENRVEGTYEGYFQGSAVTAFAIGLINGMGSGVNILILTETAVFSETHKKEAYSLASSVTFYQARDSQPTQEWKSKIVGKRLKYMGDGMATGDSSGYASVTNDILIDLCSGGNFQYYQFYNASFNYPESSGSNHSEKEGNGTYNIRSVGNETYLQLYFDNGDLFEYTLESKSADQVLLNGKRYFITYSEKCN